MITWTDIAVFSAVFLGTVAVIFAAAWFTSRWQK